MTQEEMLARYEHIQRFKWWVVKEVGRDAAPDLMSQAWLVSVLNDHKRNTDNPGDWTIGVLHRTVLSHRCNPKRRRTQQFPLKPIPVEPSDGDYLFSRWLRKQIASLSLGQRGLLNLYLLGNTEKEIEEAMKISPVRYKNDKYRAIKALKARAAK